MNKKLLLLTFALLNGILLFGQKVDRNFHIYLLMGQSNMAGRGKLTEEFKNLGRANVEMLDSNSQWVKAKHPIHFDKPSISGVGPGLSFGLAMAETNSKVKIGLVPCAVGGTSIDKWVSGAYDNATDTHPYDNAVKRIEVAMNYGVVKGVIWHQGESNSGGDGYQTYLSKLVKLINNVRNLVGNPDLPFVAGELGYFKPQFQNINNVLKDLPQTVANTALVSSEGLKDKGDATHFDSPSADELGKRFAVKMLELQLVKKTKLGR